MANPSAAGAASSVPTGTPVAAASSVPPSASSPSLDRDHVVHVAIDLIDQQGLAVFSVDHLAAELGVEAGTVGRLFHTEDDLLDAIVDSMVAELHNDPEVQPATWDWQEYLQLVAHGVRRIALRHPQVFPLLATRPPALPWLRPPLRSLQWMETFLDALHRCGFSDRAAVSAYRALCSFLLGHLLLEVAALRPTPASDLQNDSDGPHAIVLRDYPRLMAAGPELSRDHADDEFGEAMECLLDRLEHQGIA